MVHREKHRMEAFVRFKLLKEDLFFASIEPDFDVLPLISSHFTKHYADQQWMIYDFKRNYGLYYDLLDTRLVEMDFNESLNDGKNIKTIEADMEGNYICSMHFIQSKTEIRVFFSESSNQKIIDQHNDVRMIDLSPINKNQVSNY